jgi:hypothetical protein
MRTRNSVTKLKKIYARLSAYARQRDNAKWININTHRKELDNGRWILYGFFPTNWLLNMKECCKVFQLKWPRNQRTTTDRTFGIERNTINWTFGRFEILFLLVGPSPHHQTVLLRVECWKNKRGKIFIQKMIFKKENFCITSSTAYVDQQQQQQ